MRILQALAVLLAAALPAIPPAFAFTQHVPPRIAPAGHEWITRLAAVELLLGRDPVEGVDPKDPRRTWTKGLAKNLDLSGSRVGDEVARIKRTPTTEMKAGFDLVLDAIIGQRWVDIGGFNGSNEKFLRPTGPDCHDHVTQLPSDVQYDHFMRRHDDYGGAGGVRAAQESKQRFVDYFVAAATAPSDTIRVWDGGTAPANMDVNRNYFLFGRALHLLQDSFSPEHAVRIEEDGFESVRQVKGYLCTAGAEHHIRYSGFPPWHDLDIIWIDHVARQPTHRRPSNIRVPALVATEATKDAWAAFIRTMAVFDIPPGSRASAARAEATRVAEAWMALAPDAERWYDQEGRRDATYVLAEGQTGKGRTVTACMQSLVDKKQASSLDQRAEVAKIEATRRYCIFNIVSRTGYSDLFDPSLRLPYHWEWKQIAWLEPPTGYVIPDRGAGTGTPVMLRNAATFAHLTADRNGRLRVGGSQQFTPLGFTLVQEGGRIFFRSQLGGAQFLAPSGGSAILYSAPSTFRLEHVQGDQAGAWVFSIASVITKRVLGERNGQAVMAAPAADDRHLRWRIDGLTFVP